MFIIIKENHTVTITLMAKTEKCRALLLEYVVYINIGITYLLYFILLNRYVIN